MEFRWNSGRCEHLSRWCARAALRRPPRRCSRHNQTVSKAIKHLEDEIGVPLFDRIGHRSKLTAAGEIVYQRALRMLAERNDLMAELDQLRGLKRGTLRLGLPPVGSSTLFAPLFAAYHKRHPGVEIRLVEHGGERLEELLLSGEIELAASLLPVSDTMGMAGHQAGAIDCAAFNQ